LNSKILDPRSAFIRYAPSILASAVITLLLSISRRNDLSLTDWLLAFTLLLIPWLSYQNWRRERREGLPVFAMIALMYWIYYGLQLFWGDRAIEVADWASGREAEPEKITEAVALTLLGVFTLWLGLKSRLGARLAPRRDIELSINPSRLSYVRLVLVLSSVLSFSEPSLLLFGSGVRQPLGIVISTVPMLAFMLLFRRYLRGEANSLDKLLIVAFLVARSLGGLSSGWLGSFASIIIVCAAAYVAERHRMPRIALIAVVVFILFFQVGKNDFRNAYWTQPNEASKIERVSFWVNSSLELWRDALTDSSGTSVQTLFGRSLSRVSLLTQSANVLEQTPRVVPYQYGRLYSYLFITWIPRFVWPNKPSVSEANQFYQVTYGVTNEEDLDSVAIAVGVLIEAYISFGWLGVVVIMFLLGIFFDFYLRLFFGPSSGTVLSSLGIVLLPQILGIESQMAVYLGGILQQALFSLLFLLPAFQWGSARAVTPLATCDTRVTRPALNPTE